MSSGETKPSTQPQSDIAKEVDAALAKMVEAQRAALSEIVQLMAAKLDAAGSRVNDDDDTRRTLARIKAKDFCSVSEAATLLNCSSQHIRNQVQSAIDGKAAQPIPFADIGMTVFPVGELLQWAREPKTKKKSGAARKNKTHLKAVAAGSSLS
jgi:hypothetical protein